MPPAEKEYVSGERSIPYWRLEIALEHELFLEVVGLEASLDSKSYSRILPTEAITDFPVSTECDNLRPACGYCTELQINCTYDDPTNHST